MMLLWIIAVLIVGGFLAWFTGKFDSKTSRWISVFAIGFDMAIIFNFWVQNSNLIHIMNQSQWLLETNLNWVTRFGIRFHLAVDGLSLLLIILTLFLGLISVLVSWNEIQTRVGFFHFNLLWILAGIIGVFSAMDLFLFYFFWELMLIPMYFLIGIWGHEKRIYAAYKFFIFTQASGLFMLIAILALYFIHYHQTGVYTFEYQELLHTYLGTQASRWLMFGFLLAFLVKLPAVPVHNWLPDAHTQAPTAGSVILAGLLLKTGAYGILRFILPLFPQAALDFSLFGQLLGVIGILYGAKLAFAQSDLKRLVAYTSISHMGFVLLGIFSFNELALQGVVMQIIAHAISTGALFIIVGVLQERIHTRDVDNMGGLWERLPKMGGVAMLFAMASLGLPGLGNFIAEFLILAGSFQSSNWITVLAALGLIASTIYSLRIIQRVFHGRKGKVWPLADLSFREQLVMALLIVTIVWLGLYPQPVLNFVRPVIQQIHETLPQSGRFVEITKDVFPESAKETVK